MTPDVAAAAAITGWMSVPELEWLNERAQSCKTIIEVGSFYGRSTMALARGVQDGGVVYAVDNWTGESEETIERERQCIGKNVPASWRVYERERRAVFGTFLDHLREQVNAGRVQPVRGDSLDAAAHLIARGVEADMVFIDADHGYGPCRADIDLYCRLLRDGGLMCGHDYDDVPWHDGVKRAVDERFSGVRVAPGTSIWYEEGVAWMSS